MSLQKPRSQCVSLRPLHTASQVVTAQYFVWYFSLAPLALPFFPPGRRVRDHLCRGLPHGNYRAYMCYRHEVARDLRSIVIKCALISVSTAQ